MSWSSKKRFLAVLAGEEGFVRKVWGERLAVCLAYPNTYWTGMSNLGFQSLYGLINRRPDCLCERVFLPEEEVASPGAMVSLESQRPLREFDIVAFSLSFENDYPNVLKMLEMAGIPFLRSERSGRDPLILGGGIAATLNPEPLADFFDLFLLGEGEANLPPFLDAATSGLRDMPREEFLASIQRTVAGAYCPALYEVRYDRSGLIASFLPSSPSFPARIEKATAPDINSFVCEQQITASDTEFGKMFLTEVSRGCGRGCRFCAAGFVCRPPRFRDKRLLAESFERGLKKKDTIGLVGTAVSDHPDLVELGREVIRLGGSVALGSLRLDRLNDETAQLLKASAIETVALAPEAGSERLRRVIRKGVTEEQIFSAVDILARYDMLQVKLYFLVGLPTETDEDARAIVQLVKRMTHRLRSASAGKKGFRRLALSINQFIPKAATPFQWHPLEDTKVVKGRLKIITEGLRSEKAVVVTHDIPKWNYVQALLSLGDRRVGKILAAAHRRAGNWPQALREVDVNPDFFVYRPKQGDELLPWDFIDHGPKRSFLLAEYKRALEERKENEP